VLRTSFQEVDAKMSYSHLFFLAILSLFISVTYMLFLTIIQQTASLWVRLLTVAALPAPSLALFLGTVALIFTNSRQWGIRVAILGYIIAMIIALPTQKIIISLWRFITKGHKN
jgi:hypothetical protein